jgi:hypothetical protein
MRIVAVGALQEPFVYPVLDGHRKLGSYLAVASVTKLGLAAGEKCFESCGAVYGVAIGTNYVS